MRRLLLAHRIKSSDFSSGSVDQAAIGASAVGQGELKTTFGESSVLSTTPTSITLPGGSYGFFVSLHTALSAGRTVYWGRDNGTDTGHAGEATSSTPVTTIKISGSDSTGAIGRQYYVQASPPYDEGDGVIGLYIYAVVSGNPMKIHSMYVAPEAPYHYNGFTNVAAKYIRNGIPMRKEKGGSAGLLQGIWTPDQIATDPIARKEFLDAQQTEIEIEITQDIKMRDRDLIPHPFQMSDYPPGAKVIQLDPVCDCNHELLELHDAGVSISDMIMKHIKIGNNSLNRNSPKDVMPVSINWR